MGFLLQASQPVDTNGVSIQDAVNGVLVVVIPFLTAKIVQYINAHKNSAFADAAVKLGRIAVYGAEELSHKAAKGEENVPGSVKLEKAATDLVTLGRGAGLKLTEKQAKAIIEGVLNEVRPYMGEPDVEVVDEEGNGPERSLPEFSLDPELLKQVERIQRQQQETV